MKYSKRLPDIYHGLTLLTSINLLFSSTESFLLKLSTLILNDFSGPQNGAYDRIWINPNRSHCMLSCGAASVIFMYICYDLMKTMFISNIFPLFGQITWLAMHHQPCIAFTHGLLSLGQQCSNWSCFSCSPPPPPLIYPLLGRGGW